MQRWAAIGATVSLCACVGPSGPAAIGSGDAAWLASAQRYIAEREYRASQTSGGLQAPNRAHGLRTYFDASGIRVHDRTSAGSAQLLRLSVARIGRGDDLAELSPGTEIVPDGNRVEIHRPGFVEWYVNSRAGLEQGFRLDRRPDGAAPLVLELSVGSAKAAQLGDAVSLVANTGRRLRYGELAAF